MKALAAELCCVSGHAEPWKDRHTFVSDQGCRENEVVILCDSKISETQLYNMTLIKN